MKKISVFLAILITATAAAAWATWQSASDTSASGLT